MKFMRNTLAKIIFVLLLSVFFISGKVETALQKEINELSSDSVLVHGSWGLCVMTADSGKLIAYDNMQQSLIPASTLKILTTGAAIGLLGPAFKYETTIEYDGIYDSINGIIKGNVYLHGAGDPTLNSFRYATGDTISLFESLPFRLAWKGIKKLKATSLATLPALLIIQYLMVGPGVILVSIMALEHVA